jgi:PAS domain S-box-containing protein
MILRNDSLAPEILQELCDTIAQEIHAVVSTMGEGGRIVASSARERIGDVHDGAARIMNGEIDEYGVTAQEAARSRVMREGYNLAIDYSGQRLWSLAIAAPLDKARPFGRLAREWVLSHLNAQHEARQRVAAVQVSERRFRDFAEIASDWFWETDENLRWTYFSERFQEVTGIAPADLIGKTRAEVGIGSADPQAWNKHLDDLAHRRPFRNFEYPIRNSEDKIRFLRISARPIFDSAGTFIGYRGIGTDVTDRRLAEAEIKARVEELRALGDVSQAVNSTLDLEKVLTTIVAKAVQLSGTEAGAIYTFDGSRKEFRLRATYGMDEAIVATVRDRPIGLGETAIGKAAADRMPLQIADALKESSLVLDVVVRAGYRALLVVPMLRPNQIIGALVVRRKAPGEFPDSTVKLLQTFADQSVLAIQHARLFRELDEKSRELEIASQHKSQFLANMSHELRTPLNAILGYTELMLDNVYGNTSDKMHSVLQRIESNGKHLLDLINDVLDLSKIEAGRLVLALADYSLKTVVETVYTAVEPLAQEKKLAFKVDVAPNLPVGHGDERRLVQVLFNLVSNAIKFTDSGEVAIKASNFDGSFEVAVRDTGPGISMADQSKLFQLFQQADNSITRKKGGTGLGLAISKRIVEIHGGRIWMESIPGHGSTFAFRVPVMVEEQAKAA